MSFISQNGNVFKRRYRLKNLSATFNGRLSYKYHVAGLTALKTTMATNM